MNKCPDCQIEPTFTYGTAVCVYCSECERTTQNYASQDMAMEAWNNGDTKTKDELRSIWEKSWEKIKESNKKPYYMPPNADMNFTNKNSLPPEVEYKKDMMTLDRTEVIKITKTKEE